MSAHQSLIDELETVITHRSIGDRADLLRQVTDLFVCGSGSFDAEQTAVFDDVMSRLIAEIETSARIEFGERLATLPNAPSGISRTLALDDSIKVAGPMLTHSERLDEQTLIVGAKTKSQEHLLAISRRKSLSENVTDVLVERGNQQVCISTVANSGARFSGLGYSTLVSRSGADDELAVAIWSRPEIPREHLLRLFAAASEAVRAKLEAADRGKAALIRDMVKQASEQIQEQARNHSTDFAAAQAKVQTLHAAGVLTEDQLHEFAESAQFDETTVALSLLSNFPIGTIERVLVHDNSDQLLLLAKSTGLSWKTTKAILSMSVAGRSRSLYELEECFSRFARLKPETARTAIHFYRLRERANKPTAQ